MPEVETAYILFILFGNLFLTLKYQLTSQSPLLFKVSLHKS